MNELVKEKILTDTQKDDLLLTSKLSLLTGENFDLIRAVKTDKTNSPFDFIDWEKSDWLKVIKDKEVTLPDGEDSPESYAENIRETVEKSFPTHYFLHRTINNAPTNDLIKLSKSLEPLLKNNVKLFTGEALDIDSLTSKEWKGIDTDKQNQIKKDFTKLMPIVNTYRHLGIGEIIDKENTVEKKETEISKRLSAFNTFYTNNPNINLELTNFSVDLNIKKEDGLEWKGIDVEMRPLIQKQMAAFQRAHILGETHEIADKLLKGGYDAASIITSMSEEDFIKNSGLGIEKGRRVYERANNLAIGASHYFEAIRDGIKGKFKDITVANQHPLVNDLREIDGFDKLFGSQDYCDCEHCRSVLGPAAYFTDLMYFVQENVSKKVFVGNNINHPLYLKRRRPDLWTLKLTCHNTSNEIPYLDVVNEVLENYLNTELAISDVYYNFKTADWSIYQPFNLSLEELRLYLSHFDISLYDVYKDMHIESKKLHREKLKLSSEELNIITTENTAGALKRFRNKSLNKFDVQEFISYAGITREELDDLLKTSFLPEIAKIKVKTIKDSSDIQKYSEVLENLTDSRLDLIHRYLRLWKKTSWNLREYDLLLMSLKSEGLLNNLEDNDGSGYPRILQLAQLIIIQDNLKLTVEELASIVYQLSQKTLIDNEKSFAERIFNLDKINDASIPKKTPFLLAGLGITEAELLILVNLLSIDLTQPITIDVLSRLYRHARVAKALKMNIEDFNNALLLVLNGQPLKNLEDIEKPIEFSDWLKKSPLKISELVFILRGIETTSNKYKIDLGTISEKVLEIQKQEAIEKEIDPAKKLEDYLQTKFNLTQKQFKNEFLLNLIANDFNSASTKALNANFTNDNPDNPNDFDELIELIHKLERYNLLFSKHQFKPDSITYLINQKDVFGINDLKALTVDDIKNISLYRELILENEDIELKLQKTLTDFQINANFNGNESTLADLWKQPTSLIRSLLDNLTFNKPALNAIKDFWAALKICQKLGIQGDSLVKLTGDDYKSASEVTLGAFTSKYDNEKIRKEKLEPYTDKINTLKRDALCDYIISRYDKFKFKDREDLYSFFLLSVEMGGCFRTSKLVAAITSLQLYIHRCLVNLEQSDKNLNPNIPDVKVLPTFIPLDEWEWRKNYRVWEANRKVFLYPENYIDPTLRDTRTHIFKELEDELLQQKITKESAEAAYKKYLSQFTELTRLRYAGAYYHQVFDNYGYVNLNKNIGAAFFMIRSIYFPLESDDSCYYLFARTNVQPYQYYYRTYNHNRKIWGNWIKIELGIEAKEISPLIHQGKLYIFWTEVKSKERNKISGGDSTSDGFVFKAYVKYSFLNENGKWSAPQRLSLGQGVAIAEKIYGRARTTNSFDLDRWEKEKDSIIENYEEKAFRKPYSYTNKSDISTPIGLSYIWTNNKSNQEVTYKTIVQSLYYNFGSYDIRFDLPSQTFKVENNDFSNASKKITVTATIRILPGTPFEISFKESSEGTIRLLPGICFFSISLLGIPIIIPIPVRVEVTNLPITESTFRLSLSRNLISNPKEQNIFGNTTINIYKKEFDVAYFENGDFITHIENGTKPLTNHTLRQDKDGLAGIQILKDSNINYTPLTTILTDELADVLYAKGLEHFLSLQTQEMTDNEGQQFNFGGPYGEYYWEIFFHIPFLIANHFNANQKFKEAKWWYERIFNPTTDEKPANTKPTDHNWQFREFRGLTPQKLKDILTDVKAIEVYKKDPFDPHAIAQLRISSYQKAIVMKYIDNLLDWGDYLFAQDTRESINEAEMLYQIAFNILGKRPVKMGKCETADENKLTYEEIGPRVGKGSEFLITLENYYWTQKQTYDLEVGFIKSSKSLSALIKKSESDVNFKELGKLVSVQRASDLIKTMNTVGGISTAVSTLNKAKEYMAAVKSYENIKVEKSVRKEKYSRWMEVEKTIEKKKDFDGLKFKPHKRFPSFDLVKQISLVFCVPENKDLIQYWDRVEDRLFKIWNCMNIKGIRRSLSLFQPPIDPMMLVRLRASGLSLEDAVASVIDSKIPNYRFIYLIEKAKQFTQTVQGFGSALLSALEKKDGEELTLLRTVHEKNILRMTREIKKRQIQEAKAQLKSTEEGLKNVGNRVEYYNGLIDAGLIPWEITEQVSKWTAGGIRMTEATFGFLASAFGFLPQIGSPFAMKYGGVELKSGTKSLADATGALAAIADNIAILAGLEASHQRREQEWKQQLKLSEQEYKQVNQQLIAAEIRQQIAERDLEIHEKNMEQVDELYDFYKNKFTNLGLYNYMASSLNRLYRAAYNIAYELAKLAERAYQFERFDNSIFIQSDNWQFDKAGLLAAEKLLHQLQELENKYIKDNVRIPEITQSFSLALLDSSQLIQLRQTGSCIIQIPEIAFEVLYPGQYRRTIKSVHVTIPCIAGPYTNISAKLTLLKGMVEKEDKAAIEELVIAKNTSITTSNANNDSGMFDFNFRDERYLPFEGAGAISEWQLELPAKLRSFNYDTISDILLHISYTALDGDRVTAEDTLASLVQNYASTNGLFRLFSLRHEFPNSFTLLFSQNNQKTDVTIEKIHFPYVLLDKDLIIEQTKIYLKPKKDSSISVPSNMKINGNNTVNWSAGDDIAFPNGVSDDKNKIKGGTVNLSGNPDKKWTIDAGTNGLNKDHLEDILLLIKYRI